MNVRTLSSAMRWRRAQARSSASLRPVARRSSAWSLARRSSSRAGSEQRTSFPRASVSQADTCALLAKNNPWQKKTRNEHESTSRTENSAPSLPSCWGRLLSPLPKKREGEGEGPEDAGLPTSLSFRFENRGDSSDFFIPIQTAVMTCQKSEEKKKEKRKKMPFTRLATSTQPTVQL
jgi:hypothetical protein